MKYTGNLFEIARQQLEKKKRPFTALRVVNRAIAIRRKLDRIEVLKHRKANKKYYMKKRTG
jgi:hypothetical protein